MKTEKYEYDLEARIQFTKLGFGLICFILGIVVGLLV